MNVRLRWNDNDVGEGVVKYRVYQSDMSGKYGEVLMIKEVSAQFPPPQCIIMNLNESKQWFFVVSAVNRFNVEGPYSNEVTCGGSASIPAPSAPTGLTIQVE